MKDVYDGIRHPAWWVRDAMVEKAKAHPNESTGVRIASAALSMSLEMILREVQKNYPDVNEEDVVKATLEFRRAV